MTPDSGYSWYETELYLHANVAALSTTLDALTVSRRGAHREASCQMDTIGLDLHKRESQLSIKAENGTITERRIVTSRERFTAVLGNRPGARILLEASTESEWVARHLEALGHEVIVADPNYAPMYATRSRRVKTDKRNARTLMDTCGQGTSDAANLAIKRNSSFGASLDSFKRLSALIVS